MRYLIILFLSFNIQAETYKGLTVTPEIAIDGFNRQALFGNWIDSNHDGEDTRQEVLYDESWTIVGRVGNKIMSGLWFDPYTGFITEDSTQLDIDHMVPLKETYISGAKNWTKAERVAYANDMDNLQHLIAVWYSSNRSKGSRDPASWMPPNRAYWCQYLNDWVQVKKNYSLTIDTDERDALIEGFKVCDEYVRGDKLEGKH